MSRRNGSTAFGALLALGSLLPACGDVGLAIVGGDSSVPDVTLDAPADAPFMCRSDADCVGSPLGPVCDTLSGLCRMRGCPTGQTMCSGACVDVATSANHCGACGRVCPAAPNATPSCAAGTCGITCNTGFADCDGNAANGCEVDLRTDAAHCGACTNVCPAGARGMATCAGGVCGAVVCTAGSGFADCNMMAVDGCEVNTNTDVNHCGMCGSRCMLANATAGCASGACTVARCDVGFGDCNMMPADGCEVDLRITVAHCGMCGRACTSGPHSTPTCMASTCGLTCDPGWADCNGLAADGCEVNIAADVNNCGRCTNRCMLANATPTCTMGACAIQACAPNFGDCDRMAANGCEANFQTDNANCGACGRACAGGAQCNGGYCNRFPSTGADGPFNPTRDTALPPGVRNYTTINIPAGVTVRSDGSAPLDLRATGAVVINGIIDVSGGNGGRIVACNNSGSSGGSTGAATDGATNATCAGGALVCPGVGGGGGAGLSGLMGALSVGGAGGNRGGGGGGAYLSAGASSGSGGGGGGGGFAGGGGGAGAGRGCGAALGSGGGGGAGGGLGGAPGGGLAGTAGSGGTAGTGMIGTIYGGIAGFSGGLCSMVGAYAGGGGGGSIGADAAADLPVDRDTFRPGSSGGGGGGPSGGGGGGGGGAVRIASPVSITIGATGQVLARGGSGAVGNCGGGGGGGGSGGLIYLYARSLAVASGSTVGADFGGGGFAVGGGGLGGPGGLGRIRISVLPTSCTLAPVFLPTVEDHELCALTPGAGVPGQAYLRTYPD